MSTPRSTPGGPLAFCVEDFDAFLPEQMSGGARWREALRQRLRLWANSVLGRLSRLGMGAELLLVDDLLDGRPRLRAVFLRDEVARAQVARALARGPSPSEAADGVALVAHHTHLALTIDSVHVEVALELPAEARLDARAFRARLAHGASQAVLTAALTQLPDPFSMGVLGVPHFPGAHIVTPNDARAMLDDAKRYGRSLWLGWSVRRELVLDHSRTLGDQLEDALVALAEVYPLFACAPEALATPAAARGREPRKRGRVTDEAGEGPRRARHGRDVEGEDGAERDGDGAASLAPRSDVSPLSRLLERAANRGMVPRARLPVRRAVPRLSGADDPKAPIERGASVRVLTGPFEGKIAVVEEVDGRGEVRVRLGLLAVGFRRSELVAHAPVGAPKLASSHRRPRKPR